MRLNYIITVFIFLLCFLSCKNEKKLFTKLTSQKTNITFTNFLDTTKNYKALYFFYYFNGGGVAIGDINNDGLSDIYFTSNNKSSNKLYLNKGHMKFEDITKNAGVEGIADWSTGASMADINGDGYLDIYVSSVNNIYNMKGRNALYINNQNNTFTESAVQYGLDFSGWTTQTAFFDYDKDGDLDCYILNQSQKPNENLRDTSHRKEFHPMAGDKLMRNDISTTGKFIDVSKEAGIYQSSLGYGLGLAISDLNQDGFQDIYVGNDFHENDFCYINLGNGKFKESGSDLFGHHSRFSMGNDIADYNNDGLPDIFTTDMLPDLEIELKTYGSGESWATYKQIIEDNGYHKQFSRNCLHRNNAGRSFSDVSLMSSIYATDWSWSPLMADFDLDGNKDLFISSGIVKRTIDLDFINYLNSIIISPGQDARNEYDKAIKKMPDGSSCNFFFKGNGNENFIDISKSAGFDEAGYHTGASYSDLDNDGDLDIVVNPINKESFIYENNIENKKFLSLKLIGNKKNTSALGSRIWCFSKEGIQFAENQHVRGFQSSSNGKIIFGFNTSTEIDSLLVVWNDGSYDVLIKPNLNKEITLSQKPSSLKFKYENYFSVKKQIVKKNDEFKLNWKHTEDKYNDFELNNLQHHQLSKLGPKIIKSDINQDGFDDIFVCGASNQASVLFVSDKVGKFSAINETMFGKHAGYEDTDAIFIDVNNDKFEDLIVVSGSYTNNKDNDKNIRLYKNDGINNFIYQENAMPKISGNLSCIAAVDIDKDGDKDLLVGIANIASASDDSSLIVLKNDNKGNFQTGSNVLDTKNLNQVYAISLADVNNDSISDIVIAQSWGPIVIYQSNKNLYVKKKLNENGLWKSCYTSDIDKDGDVDIIAGNIGKNSKLAANNENPLFLYVKDFDNNGSREEILAKSKGDNIYPFFNKDILEKPLPFLKKKFNYFKDFAGQPIDKIFDTSNSQIYSITETSSGIYYNNGGSNFTFTPFPADLQLSPIYAINQLNDDAILLGGNFNGVHPYEGCYDAAAFSVFHLKNKKVELISTKGEVRSIQCVKTALGESIMIGYNNGNLESWKKN